MTTKKDKALIPFLNENGRSDDNKADIYAGVIAGALLTTGLLFVGKELLTKYLEVHLFEPRDANHKPLGAPEEYGLKGEAQKLPTGDGDEIEIWRLEGKEEQPTVIFQHGNTGNFAYISKDPKHQEENTAFRIEFLKKLQDKGVETIAISSRGFGNSTGTPSEENFKRDAKAVADYMHENNIKPENTIVIGESMGTSTAAILTEEMASRGEPPAGLTLIAPFSSLRQQVYDASAAPNWLVDIVLNHPLETDNRLSHISRASKEKGITPPSVLIVSPKRDKIIHPSHSDDLVMTAVENNIPVMQQYQDASHVNWDAEEVIDDSLKLHEERKQLLKHFKEKNWENRVREDNKFALYK